MTAKQKKSDPSADFGEVQPSGAIPAKLEQAAVEDRESDRSIEEMSRMFKERRAVAAVLAATAAVLFAAAMYYSWQGLSEATRYTNGTLRDGPSRDAVARIEAAVFAVGLIGHSIIVVAVVLFCYQLIRAAERLYLPPTLLNSRNVEVLRTLVGVESPVDRVAKLVEDVAKIQKGLTTPAGKKGE